MLRLDLLVAALARRTLWITDAYFIGHGPYLEALRRAAHDGVDVRLLLPQDSDVGWTVPVSRSLYRPLLEAGRAHLRMERHDDPREDGGRRLALGAHRLDEPQHQQLDRQLGAGRRDRGRERRPDARKHYLEDLEQSTEIVLGRHAPRARGALAGARGGRVRPARRVVRAVTGVGRSIGAAVTGNRPLEDFESRRWSSPASCWSLLAGLAFWQPKVLAWPVVVMAGWTGASFLVEACPHVAAREPHVSGRATRRHRPADRT